MTPAINIIKKHKISYRLHEYSHDESSDYYGLEAADKMGVDKEIVFKTLVVMLDNKELAVSVIPVSSMLSMKLIAKVFGVKKSVMADKFDVERSTGYVLGGVSPLGQKKQLNTVIDSSVMNHSIIYVSAGRRGLEIALSPDDLITLTGGFLDNICQ
jgi:Cys-tRNA(Pro)/Cys-tRNA(Cys) deacylase